ncbi:hypothetical protein SNEBB_006581, partial [Seison nebaliae]
YDQYKDKTERKILSDICGMRFIAIYWTEFRFIEKTLDIEAHPNQNHRLSKENLRNFRTQL